MFVPFMPAPGRNWLAALALLGFVAIGLLGTYRYFDNYWLYRGFAPPRDPAYVTARGISTRFYVASSALGGRRQPVDVYLPPGYRTHPLRRYPVLYLLHGVPGRPGAFLATVRAGVVEDELVARHKLRPLILVMPFGSTGSFTDEEWANGVRPDHGWETFVARDLVQAIDGRYRTIPSASGRALAGLSEGRLRRAQHRPPPPRRVPRARELVGLRARRPDPARSSASTGAACSPGTARLLTLGRGPRAPSRAHVRLVLQRHGRQVPDTERHVREGARDHLAHRFFLVRGGHNWALWRGNAARALMAASRRLDVA